MADNKAKVTVELDVQNKDAIVKLQKDFDSLKGATDNSSSSMVSMAGSFAVGTMAVTVLSQAFTTLKTLTLDTAKAFIDLGIATSGSLESTTVAFKTLTGSAEQAGAIMNRIKEDAKKTPFQMEDLASLNQMLMSTGMGFEQSEKLILSFGDALAASGKGTEELKRIGVNLQQIKNLGNATAMDLKQFAFAGIDIYGMLADSTGKTREEIQKLDASAITFEMIESAMNKAAGAGGKFEGAMAAQSQTLLGLKSNLQDSLSLFASDVVTQSGVFQMFKDGIQLVIDALSFLQPIVTQMISTIGFELKTAIEEVKLTFTELGIEVGFNKETFQVFVNFLLTSALYGIQQVKMGILFLGEAFAFLGQVTQVQSQLFAQSWTFATSVVSAAFGNLAKYIDSIISALFGRFAGLMKAIAGASGAFGLKGFEGIDFKSIEIASNIMAEQSRVKSSFLLGGGMGTGGGVGGAIPSATGGTSKAQSEAQNALKQLEKARIEAIENPINREIELIKLKYREELNAFKGTADQKKEYEKLLLTKQEAEIQAINEREAKKESELKKKTIAERVTVTDKLREAEINAMEDGYEKEQVMSKFKLEKELRDFKGTEKEKLEYKKNLEKQYNIGKQQFAENIIFQGGITNADQALEQMRKAFDTWGSDKLNNLALGS